MNFEVVLRPNFESQDDYEVLGCHPSASKADITKAYRDLSRMYHPQHRPHDEEATRIFVRIGQAYASLVCPIDVEGGKESKQMTTKDAKCVYENRFGKYRKLYYDDAGIVGLPYAYALRERIGPCTPDVTSTQRTLSCGSRRSVRVGIFRTWFLKTKIDPTLAFVEVLLTWATIIACEYSHPNDDKRRSDSSSGSNNIHYYDFDRWIVISDARRRPKYMASGRCWWSGLTSFVLLAKYVVWIYKIPHDP